MKKIYFVAFAIFFSIASVMAENKVDVIIKTNSEKIEALIQEVSESEVRYKKANNPEGPMFVLSTDEISSILYANGEVQAIEHKAKPATGYYTPYGYVSGQNAEAMTRVGNEYIVGDRHLKGRELRYYLRQTCPSAYNYYNTWKNVETAGYCLLGIGAGMMIGLGVGCGQSVDWSYVYPNTERYRWYMTGVSFLIIGGAVMVGSIPMIACGNVYKKRVDEVYNVQCARNKMAFDPKLKLYAGENGLGFAFAF